MVRGGRIDSSSPHFQGGQQHDQDCYAQILQEPVQGGQRAMDGSMWQESWSQVGWAAIVRQDR